MKVDFIWTKCKPIYYYLKSELKERIISQSMSQFIGSANMTKMQEVKNSREKNYGRQRAYLDNKIPLKIVVKVPEKES